MGKLGNCDKTVICVAGDSGDCDESGDEPRFSLEELLLFCRNTMRMLMGYVYSAYLLWLHFRMVDN
jgi:hypothetical protein